MANYKLISNAGSGKCLNIYGTGQASPHRNVCLWSDSGASEQQWSISTLSGNTRVLSVLNTAYGLNIWRGTDNKNNCDIYPISGNAKDSLITVEAFNGNYRFKMTNYNLYLTAKGSANGSDVRWEAWTGSTNQQWEAVNVGEGTVDPPVSGEYTYPTDSRIISTGGGFTTSHTALDIRDAAGSPLYAFADGVVSFTRPFNGNWVPGSPGDTKEKQNSMDSMGNMITINYINPDTAKKAGAYARTVYMHMKNASAFKAGNEVKKGQKVGEIGNTGRSTGAHLHFVLCVGNNSLMKPGATGWIKNKDAPTINPTIYLPEYR
ncbi:MAG: peptidoglycan DD-metalloendopeptidase family protein [Oscillospiraceae bacterium]